MGAADVLGAADEGAVGEVLGAVGAAARGMHVDIQGYKEQPRCH